MPVEKATNTKRQARSVGQDRPALLDAVHRTEVQASLLAWFAREEIDLPWRRDRDPYAVLVSEFMLQQTQRERVAPKFRAFIGRFPTFSALADAAPADVIRAWAGLGYNSRALRLHAIARAVVADPGALSADPARLQTLPGVGAYTAAAIACFAHDAQVACVDTNVRRVLGRVFLGEEFPKPRPARDAELAAAVLPAGRAADWNAALMDLGALVCKARAPRCEACPLAARCRARPRFAASPGTSERRVAEVRPAYRAGEKGARRRSSAPFSATDRYLRGRIVDVLRGLADGEAIGLDGLALAATGMALPPQTERVALLAARLVREGLIVQVIGEDGQAAYRLPG